MKAVASKVFKSTYDYDWVGDIVDARIAWITFWSPVRAKNRLAITVGIVVEAVRAIASASTIRELSKQDLASFPRFIAATR